MQGDADGRIRHREGASRLRSHGEHAADSEAEIAHAARGRRMPPVPRRVMTGAFAMWLPMLIPVMGAAVVSRLMRTPSRGRGLHIAVATSGQRRQLER